jgi:hypothetical protein
LASTHWSSPTLRPPRCLLVPRHALILALLTQDELIVSRRLLAGTSPAVMVADLPLSASHAA